MNLFALELNDAGMLGLPEDGPLQKFGPGYALYEDGRFHYGLTALNRSRLKPRWICNQFWQNIETQPLGRPFPKGVTPADLIHGQFTHLSPRLEDKALILLLPDGLTQPELALLFGILQAGNLKPVGMTTVAMAAASHSADHLKPGRVHHLELNLHRPVKTTIMVSSTHASQLRLEKQQASVLQAPGLKHLLDAWVQAISRRFVHETRFDPLHAAETEQRLFSGLPQWLQTLREQDRVEIALDSGNRSYRIELQQAHLAEAAREIYEAILNRANITDQNGVALLSQRLAQLPGFLDLAHKKGLHFTVLPQDAAPAGALEQAAALNDPQQLTRVLAVTTQRQIPKKKPVLQAPRPAPTHVLYKGLAHALNQWPFYFSNQLTAETTGLCIPGLKGSCLIRQEQGRILLDPQKTACSHNGSTVQSPVFLSAGDRLSFGLEPEEIQMIAVV